MEDITTPIRAVSRGLERHFTDMNQIVSAILNQEALTVYIINPNKSDNDKNEQLVYSPVHFDFSDFGNAQALSENGQKEIKRLEYYLCNKNVSLYSREVLENQSFYREHIVNELKDLLPWISEEYNKKLFAHETLNSIQVELFALALGHQYAKSLISSETNLSQKDQIQNVSNKFVQALSGFDYHNHGLNHTAFFSAFATLAANRPILFKKEKNSHLHTVIEPLTTSLKALQPHIAERNYDTLASGLKHCMLEANSNVHLLSNINPKYLGKEVHTQVENQTQAIQANIQKMREEGKNYNMYQALVPQRNIK